MIGKFIQFFSDNHLSDKGLQILLAVSGGMDSAVMADLFSKAEINFGIAHANFQLRGEESERDETFVRQLAEKYQVEFFIKRFSTSDNAKKRKLSIQVAARELRYQWFDEILNKKGYDVVATAHHLDDQVETFLINLTRGTGIAGLHGIPVKQGKIIRPLLFAWRNEIADYAALNQIAFVEDSSNLKDNYSRNKIRHQIIPQLQKINPSITKVLNDTIGNIKDVEMIFREVIEETRESIIKKNGETIMINLEEFFQLNPLKTYAYELLSPFGFNQSNISDIICLEHSIAGKEILSPSHRLIRDRENIIIIPKIEIPVKCYKLSFNDLENGIREPVNFSFEFITGKPDNLKLPAREALLDLNRLNFPLTIRKWRRGDSFIPLGMTGYKKLSDFFTDLKFSKIDKDNQWLLCSGEDIVWIIGQRIDERYKVERETLKILKIMVTP